MSDTNKTFHLAITMAGAVSAGAYTAGVVDYLLESLEKWTKLKKEAVKFFAVFDGLENKAWAELDNLELGAEMLPKAREFKSEWKDYDDEKLKKTVRRAAKLYNAIPKHDVKIEILSGASAGGMTAAISSLVLHLPEKNHCAFDAKEDDRKKNRLYDSWVNLSDDNMMAVLLGDSDIKAITKEYPKAKFPVSLLNSKFVRDIANDALELSEEERKCVELPDYVAKDFHLFVTMTNLKGYERVVRLDANKQNPQQYYPGDFITYDHRDLAMFNFADEEKGVINIDFKTGGENLKLLRDAAVSTGAFPIGLEYGFYDVESKYIKNNELLKAMYDDLDTSITTHNFRSAMIDGGLINNEPFELTEELLMIRLKKMYKESDEQKIRDMKNHTILIIDPFPSEKRMPKTRAADEDLAENMYPYDFFGAIGQLIMAVRTQLLIKPKLIKKAFDEGDFSCFLIAPKRRVFQKDKDGKLKKENGRYVLKYETDENGNKLANSDGSPIPSVYNGSLAIACGCLGGFGGFLDKSFRKHDFRLGQINCKSFLRNHFRFNVEKTLKNPVFKDSYKNEAAEIFNVKDDGAEFYPLIPDVNIIEDLLDGKLSKTQIMRREDIETLYGNLKFPKYDLKKFDELEPQMFYRLNYILSPYINKILSANLFGKIFGQAVFWIARRKIYGILFQKIRATVEKQLKDWQLVR
ncbi:MAG: hypothetical protein ACR2MG_07885 [Pyrinomonadaceae bacterium]